MSDQPTLKSAVTWPQLIAIASSAALASVLVTMVTLYTAQTKVVKDQIAEMLATAKRDVEEIASMKNGTLLEVQTIRSALMFDGAVHEAGSSFIPVIPIPVAPAPNWEVVYPPEDGKSFIGGWISFNKGTEADESLELNKSQGGLHYLTVAVRDGKLVLKASNPPASAKIVNVTITALQKKCR